MQRKSGRNDGSDVFGAIYADIGLFLMMRHKAEKYDLYVANFGPAPKGVRLPFEPELLAPSQHDASNAGPVLRCLSLLEAKTWVALFQINSSARLRMLPSRYRDPLVSKAHARVIALGQWKRLVAQGQPLAPLDAPLDDDLWWTFGSDHLEWQAEGLIPGRIWFHVDKLDGHLASEFDVKEYYDAIA